MAATGCRSTPRIAFTARRATFRADLCDAPVNYDRRCECPCDRDARRAHATAIATAGSPAVAPQYDTSHVYVAIGDVDRFANSFLATFGGQSTNQVPRSNNSSPIRLCCPAGRWPTRRRRQRQKSTSRTGCAGGPRSWQLCSGMSACISTSAAHWALRVLWTRRWTKFPARTAWTGLHCGRNSWMTLATTPRLISFAAAAHRRRSRHARASVDRLIEEGAGISVRHW